MLIGEHKCVHGHNILKHKCVAWEHGCVTYVSIPYAFYTIKHNYVGLKLRFRREQGLKHDHVVDHIHNFNSKLH